MPERYSSLYVHGTRTGRNQFNCAYSIKISPPHRHRRHASSVSSFGPLSGPPKQAWSSVLRDPWLHFHISAEYHLTPYPVLALSYHAGRLCSFPCCYAATAQLHGSAARFPSAARKPASTKAWKLVLPSTPSWTRASDQASLLDSHRRLSFLLLLSDHRPPRSQSPASASASALIFSAPCFLYSSVPSSHRIP